MIIPTTPEELLCQAALYALDNEKLYGVANILLTRPERFVEMVNAECSERVFRNKQKR